MDCCVATIAGSDQALLHHGDLCLAFRYDTFELLHHNTERDACLLHRLPKSSLLLAGRDHGGYTLYHGLTIEQNQAPARDQQENVKKTNNCNSLNSPLNIQFYNLSDDQTTRA